MSAERFPVRMIERDGARLLYRLHEPTGVAAGSREPLPLIVFLHGRGECGDDGRAQLTAGLGPALLAAPERFPAFVAFPQKADPDQEWEELASALGAMIDRILREHPINPSRLVLTGVSQGGHGTWTINEAMPGRFAALAPVCGYSERRFGMGEPIRGEVEAGPLTDRLVEAARTLPVWMFHGERDESIPASESAQMDRLLRARGGTVRLTLYPDLAHNCWDRAYAHEEFVAWLTSQRRE